MSTRIGLGLAALAIIFVACDTGPVEITGEKDESFARYGQVFKGKIAKSYAESEE